MAPIKIWWSGFVVILISISYRVAKAEDGAVYDDDAAAAGDDDNGNGAYEYFDDNYEGNDDYIKYWTEYAILPKRCIVYNDVDVIVFSVFDHAYKQCSDDAIGTYIAPVPQFLDGYMEQYEQTQYDQGYDDYQIPDAAAYTSCTQQEINGVNYYFQVGCSDGTSQALAINIYEDNTCTTRSVVDGYDDSNVDTSGIQIPFKQCQNCVLWGDMSDDQVDDMYYENRQTQAPLCSTAWTYKETCNRKCQRTGLERNDKEGWNTSDKILLAILSAFGLIMLVTILRKRQKMSNKDALLEQAAMSAAGLQQAHVIGIFILVVLVVAVFALLGLKNITWALLLVINTVLFGYLMKLTVDSGVSAGETVIGPDGSIIRRNDSDDSSVASTADNRNVGTYTLPQLA